MAITGQAGSRLWTAGISEALVATAAGLVVAIVALAAYNWFVTIINSFAAFSIPDEELVQHQRDKGSLYADVSMPMNRPRRGGGGDQRHATHRSSWSC